MIESAGRRSRIAVTQRPRSSADPLGFGVDQSSHSRCASAPVEKEYRSGSSQLAASSATKLNDNGFLNVTVAQAPDAGNYPTSQVIDYSGNLSTARLIAQALGLPDTAVTSGDPSQANGQNIVVILGNDAPNEQGP